MIHEALTELAVAQEETRDRIERQLSGDDIVGECPASDEHLCAPGTCQLRQQVPRGGQLGRERVAAM